MARSNATANEVWLTEYRSTQPSAQLATNFGEFGAMPHVVFVDSVNDIPWIEPILWVHQGLPLIFDFTVPNVYDTDLADTRTISVGSFHRSN